MFRIHLSISVIAMSVLALNACTLEINPPPLPEQNAAPVDVGPPDDTTVEHEQETGTIVEVGGQNTGSSPGQVPTSGEGTTEEVVPVWEAQVQQPAVFLVAGAAHACAMTASGDVSCWGRNDVGQLGYGHTDAIGDDEPAATHGVVDVGGPVVSLTAGQRHTCAILDKGSIRCWGYGGDLALGNGNGKDYTVGDDETPADMYDAIIYSNSPFVQLAAGDHHTCMRTEEGSIKCWGDSPEGALGYGYATQTGGWLGNVPIGEDASFLVAGAEHTCAVVEGGLVRCWGEAKALGYGGDNNIGDDEAPSEFPALSVGAPVTQLAAGDRHTCALTTAGTVHCWGLGHGGVLGYGSTQSVDSATLAGVVNVGGVAVQVAAGQSHTCALLLDGSVRCWGDGTSGALGYGNTHDIGDNEAPATAGAVELPEPVTQIVAGTEFTCALLASGAVQCWGSGLDGRLGYGHDQSVGDDETPSAMMSILPFGN